MGMAQNMKSIKKFCVIIFEISLDLNGNKFSDQHFFLHLLDRLVCHQGTPVSEGCCLGQGQHEPRYQDAAQGQQQFRRHLDHGLG